MMTLQITMTRLMRRWMTNIVAIGLAWCLAPLPLAVAATGTTTALASATSPSIVGGTSVLTATVEGSSATTGTVTFKDGTTTMATVPLSGTGSTKIATYTATFNAVGAHSLTAVYSGDTNNNSSTSTAVPQTVNQKATTTVVASSLNPSTSAASVTITALVVGYNPSGTVTFKDGATTLGTGILTGNGNSRTATFTTTALSVAEHTISAAYGGDTLNAASTSANVTQTVNQKVTTVAVTSSVNPTQYSGSTTLTATISGGNAPTGTITFMDGATILGTGTVVTAKATLAVTNLIVGAHSITAVYGGDTNNAASTSAAISQTVNLKVNTVAVASSVNPTVQGGSTTLTSTIAGAITPTGTVTFKDGTTTLGTGTVSGTTATLAIATLSNGTHAITAVYAGDTNNAASTSAALTQTVKSAPTTVVTSNANPSFVNGAVTFTASVTGNGPTGTVTFRDGATTLGTGTLATGVATFTTSSLTAASHTITAVYAGDALNAASTSSAITQTVNKITSTTTLAASADPILVGGSTTFIATVTGALPTGTVTFKDGTTTLGTGTIASGLATYTANALAVGAHSITAVYLGDTVNATSTSGPLTQTVTKATSTTMLTSSVNPSVYGGSTTFKVAVVGNAPTGTVTFKDGATTLGTGTLASGAATYASAALTGGTHSITAVYGGDAKNAGSTSVALVQTVNPKVTTLALTASVNPSTYGGSTTITATVSGGASPAGTVTFKDGTTTIGTSTVASAKATLAIATLTGGAHSITAVYSGDANNATSTAPTLTQNVNVKATTTVVTSSLNPSIAGGSVTLTAKVTGGAPTGTVTFKDGASAVGTGTISGTTATLAISTLTSGAHSITAVYSGDANNAPSTSSALTQNVSKKSTTTVLTSNANPNIVGLSTTLTATVSGVTPTGTVTFMDGATSIGTGLVSGTTATIAIATLSAGTHALTAVYSGDINNATSTSINFTQTVNKRVTTTTLASSANPTAYGGETTFTATVSGVTSPSGSVTFKDGAIAIATVLVNSTTGLATLATNSLIGGAHNITAVYGGDINNAASTSAVLVQTVNINATSTALSSDINPTTYGSNASLTATIFSSTTPSGTVTFKDGATTIGSGIVYGNIAVLAINTLTGGTHALTAVYSGDNNNASSTSPPLIQTVNAVASSVTLTSSANTSKFGNAVTFTATVNGSNPSGIVTFKDGATVLGSGTIASGVSTLAVASLSVGMHPITAIYAGDSNNNSSASSELAQAVSAAASSTNLASSANPSALGSSVTFTATVSGSTPTGTVIFQDYGAALGTVAITSGSATYTTSSLSDGLHQITASYTGDTNNLPSTSYAMTQSIAVGTTGGNISVYRYGYDAMGRPTIAVNPNNQTTYIYYDTLGRPIQVQQPANTGTSTPTTTSMTYDLADNLTSVVDPRSLTTSYAANGLGLVNTQTSPDSGQASYTFDAAGRLITKTDARGKVTTVSYDNLDRITGVSFTSGVPLTFTYDGGANPTPAARGELTALADESGSTTYGYDALGRRTTTTRSLQASAGGPVRTFTTTTAWGDSGPSTDKVTSLTYPSGNRVNYSYDAQGALSGVSITKVSSNASPGGTTTTLLSALTYNADMNITGWSWASGAMMVRSYDNQGQLASYTLGNPTGSAAAAGVRRTLSRDAAGRITGYTHKQGSTAVTVPSLTQSFAYDNLDRLTSATGTSSTVAYSYDANGNRTTTTVAGTSYPLGISTTSNRLLTVQSVNGAATIVHDSAGNITADGTNTYAYNDRSRMASATTAGGVVNYRYNALGQRVSKSAANTALVPTGSAFYVYGDGGELLGEYDASGSPLYETVYLPASMQGASLGAAAPMPVGVLKQTGTAGANTVQVGVYNVSADHLNTPRILTRQADEAIVWRWDTAEAFGASAPDQNPNSLGAFSFNQRFPGQVFDAETGLNQNWNRDYDPRLGRYRQSDPIGLAGGINTYGYVFGNPLSWTDPSGLDVYLCKQPAFGVPNGPVDHHWLKTDTAEAGMGGTKGNEAGNDSGDMPGDPVVVTDHTGRSKQKGATCEKVDGVDEKKVNDALKLGRSLGRWGPTNQCQSFARGTLLDAGWKPPVPRPPAFSFGF